MPGVHFKHFTARDIVTRWDVLQACHRATANNDKQFLEVVQVDGGSEFMAEFEQACQEKGIQLFVLPPRSPKLNGCVERAHRTHVEEFYQVYADDWRFQPSTMCYRSGNRSITLSDRMLLWTT